MIISFLLFQFSTSNISKTTTSNVRDKYKKYYENSKERKKRLWKEKQEKRRTEGRDNNERAVFSGWMYLPDLILEHIFKFLSYKVRHPLLNTIYQLSHNIMN